MWKKRTATASCPCAVERGRLRRLLVQASACQSGAGLRSTGQGGSKWCGWDARLGAMGKRTRLPVLLPIRRGLHGQASTRAHGTIRFKPTPQNMARAAQELHGRRTAGRTRRTSIIGRDAAGRGNKCVPTGPGLGFPRCSRRSNHLLPQLRALLWVYHMKNRLPRRQELLILVALSLLCTVIVSVSGAYQLGFAVMGVPVFLVAALMGFRQVGESKTAGQQCRWRTMKGNRRCDSRRTITRGVPGNPG